MHSPPVGSDYMAATDESIGDVTEECSTCDATTPHQVRIELLTEGGDGENAEYSREPYRITECRACGETTSTRMNNA